MRIRGSLILLASLLIITMMAGSAGAGRTFVVQWDKAWLSTLSPVVTEDGGILLVNGKKAVKLNASGETSWEWAAPAVITSITDDAKGGAWAAYGGVISKLESNGKLMWSYAHNDHIYSLEGLPGGEVTAGTDKGVLLLSAKGKFLWFFDPTAGCDI